MNMHFLAANRVYRLRTLPYAVASSYLARFTLTSVNRGGIVSVALSLGLMLGRR